MRKALSAVVFLYAGAALADQPVIVAFGDSLTQGFGLPAEEGFVPQMQAWLVAQGVDVKLVNAGVSGDTTAGGLARIDWTLTPDVDGMIVALGGNDVLRGLPPAEAKANLEGILQAAQAADVDVLLVGMQAGGNFGPAYKAEFDAIYPALAEGYQVRFAESFFLGFRQDGVLPGFDALLPFLQADRLHPNAEGVARIVEGMGPHVLELAQGLEE